MNINYRTILESVKKVRPRDLLYPSILVVFFIVVGIVFFFATRFISQSINKVFSFEQSTETQALDLARYALVAKKLGIPLETGAVGGATPVAPPIEAEVAPSAPISAETILDESKLSIAIYNGTKTAGLAGKLKSVLEEAGFTVKKTGNKSNDYPQTTIEIKEAVRSALPRLEQLVGDRYEAIIKNAPADATYDVVIIIGNK